MSFRHTGPVVDRDTSAGCKMRRSVFVSPHSCDAHLRASAAPSAHSAHVPSERAGRSLRLRASGSSRASERSHSARSVEGCVSSERPAAAYKFGKTARAPRRYRRLQLIGRSFRCRAARSRTPVATRGGRRRGAPSGGSENFGAGRRCQAAASVRLVGAGRECAQRTGTDRDTDWFGKWNGHRFRSARRPTA